MPLDTLVCTEEEQQLPSDYDLHLFREGTHSRLYQKLGAHLATVNSAAGTHFAVWAPNALRVYVYGDFNDWNTAATPLSVQGDSGIWAGFVAGVTAGAAYKYHIVSRHQGYEVEKHDPFAFRQQHGELPASVVENLAYPWSDQEWLRHRGERMHIRAPISIYEVHLPTWMRVPEEGNRPLTYRELAPRLTDYVSHMGFTHVEFLPVMENLEQPGKECDITAFFAASSRQGSPQDLMFLIDYLHQHDIGVILDWVASHFPAVDFGLTYFDGTWLFEHGTWQLTSDGSKQGYPFDYSRGEVRSFLLSNAAFWFDKYHADAIRLTSVTTMLHLDEDRKPDNWIPNAQGGRENLDAIDFLRKLNSELYRLYPDVQIIAEESSDWPMVSRPTYSGGLGFGFKWDKSFSEQLVPYLGSDPFFRKLQHEKLTSRIDHAFNENSVLSLSHAQVRDGRGSLLAQMFGDDWQRLANLRLLLGCQFLEPGKKLLFMGSEFAQWQEWNPNASLDWHLLGYNRHANFQRWVRDLNLAYRREPALYQTDSLPENFEWVISDDREHSVLVWIRRDPADREVLLVAINFTPVVRPNYHVGVPRHGHWKEILNSDATVYGGSGQGNFGGLDTSPFSSHSRPYTLTLTLPPLAVVVFKHSDD